MLTLAQVNELVDAMVAHDLATLEVKGKTYAVRMVRASGTVPGTVPGTVAPGVSPSSIEAVSPATGPFHPRGIDDGLPELEIGAHVQHKEPLGFIGIGPFRVLCASPATGRIVGELPTPEKPVTRGDLLFLVEPGE